jgi:hypothetical protein
MKRIFLLALILTVNFLFAQKNWQVYTNKTHIYQMEETEEGIYLATWGGLVLYDSNSNTFTKTYTTINGLSDQDIRAVTFQESSGIFCAGTKNEGINRIQNNRFIMPIKEDIGLMSNTVNAIVDNDSLLIAATKEGVSVFKNSDELPFPFLFHNLNIINGLSSNNITSLQLTDNGYLYCGSAAGLDFAPLDSLQYSSAWQSWNSENSELPSSKISDISANGNMLAVATENGLVAFDLSGMQPPLVYEQSAIYPIFVDSQSRIWYGYGIWDDMFLEVIDAGDIAIKCLDADELQIWEISDLDINTNAIMGFREFEDKIYAYTWGDGFITYENGNWGEQRKPNTILANLVTDIELDMNNKLWVSNGHAGGGAISKGTKGVSSFNGQVWENYTIENSGLQGHNIFTIGLDKQNRKWFGAWTGGSSEGWQAGISILDESVQPHKWEYLNTSNSAMTSNCISNITLGPEGYIWVCGYDHNIEVISTEEEELEIVHSFSAEAYDVDKKVMLTHFANNGEIYFGSYYFGLGIWTGEGWPETNDYSHWKTPPFTELTGCRIYDIEERQTAFENEIWIAAAEGLFMRDSQTWWRYGTQIKKQEWRGYWYDEFTPEYRYIEGQERLYGSVPTYPTALFIDNFDRIWIGTDSHGITVFEPAKDKFTNYHRENSPLVSNTITDFCYDEIDGKLYIGTPEGLMSVEIGIYPDNNTEEDLAKTRAFPNPFYPDKGEELFIENVGKLTMPKGETKCNIYDLAGDLVLTLEKNIYEQFTWNGLNKEGKKCSSGMYFYVVYTADGQTSQGKVVLIR